MGFVGFENECTYSPKRAHTHTQIIRHSFGSLARSFASFLLQQPANIRNRKIIFHPRYGHVRCLDPTGGEGVQHHRRARKYFPHMRACKRRIFRREKEAAQSEVTRTTVRSAVSSFSNYSTHHTTTPLHLILMGVLRKKPCANVPKKLKSASVHRSASPPRLRGGAALQGSLHSVAVVVEAHTFVIMNDVFSCLLVCFQNV